MSAQQRLTDLAEARRLLALQADLHRGVIQVECANLSDRLAWLNPARTLLPVKNPLLLAGAALAGWLAVRRWRTALRWLPAAVGVWRLVRQFLPR